MYKKHKNDNDECFVFFEIVEELERNYLKQYDACYS